MKRAFVVQSMVAAVIFSLPYTVNPQSHGKDKITKQMDTNKNQQHMDYKVNIGRIDVPKASIEDFKKQSAMAPRYLKSLPGYIKGDYFEMTDESGDLHMISVVTWQNKEFYENAQITLKKHYEEIGFNRMEFVQRLNLKIKYEAYSLLEIN
ncbi:hypothetical protein [Paraflavitalea sp. CAU 1676]|uniref:hypothetical protein n=1 Tax=Paraflavitalea sp. CAU 1676 TaxID=3032598 RepID=UPI0023DC3831|nr:hypothetical protein [Paraflavitalea sp. CAU 1676]MDF2191258.1 hypothetical protein [Paraflavitalea sp. CAU 1676]